MQGETGEKERTQQSGHRKRAWAGDETASAPATLGADDDVDDDGQGLVVAAIVVLGRLLPHDGDVRRHLLQGRPGPRTPASVSPPSRSGELRQLKRETTECSSSCSAARRGSVTTMGETTV